MGTGKVMIEGYVYNYTGEVDLKGNAFGYGEAVIDQYDNDTRSWEDKKMGCRRVGMFMDNLQHGFCEYCKLSLLISIYLALYRQNYLRK